jgi:hypothetical protein
MSELNQILDRHLGRQQPGLLRAIDEIVSGGHLRRQIASTLQADGHLPESAAYLHPNGFVKLRVASRPGSWSVRLHLWREPESESQIHSHRWDFASRVLKGSLRTRTYQASLVPGDHVQFTCERTPDDEYSFQPVEPCDVTLQQTRVHTPNQSYLQPYSLLHTVETASALPVATVIVQGRNRAKWSTVITTEEAPPKQLPVLPLEAADINAVLTYFLDLLPE